MHTLHVTKIHATKKTFICCSNEKATIDITRFYLWSLQIQAFNSLFLYSTGQHHASEDQEAWLVFSRAYPTPTTLKGYILGLQP